MCAQLEAKEEEERQRLREELRLQREAAARQHEANLKQRRHLNLLRLNQNLTRSFTFSYYVAVPHDVLTLFAVPFSLPHVPDITQYTYTQSTLSDCRAIHWLRVHCAERSARTNAAARVAAVRSRVARRAPRECGASETNSHKAPHSLASQSESIAFTIGYWEIEFVREIESCGPLDPKIWGGGINNQTNPL